MCDNESTVDIVKNKAMITNVRRAKKPIQLIGIGGRQTVVDREGDLLGYGPVYFHPEVAANISSFFNLNKRFKRVTYDNTIQDAFMVECEDGTMMRFGPSKEGLYYYDFNESIKRKMEQEQKETLLEQPIMAIQTVEAIQRNFSKREVEGTEAAQRLYVIVGRPSKKAFEDILRKGLFLNNSVTVQDYHNARTICGEDLGTLKGKMVRSKTEHVKVDLNIMPKVQQTAIVLSVDILYWFGLTFLVTVSRDIRFITATVLGNRKKDTILSAIQQVIRVYQGRGHKIDELEFNVNENPIHTILADNEFQALREDIEERGIRVNIVAKEEHVPEVERQNRVIKERARAMIQTLPYKKIPKKMKIALIQYVVYWLNNIPKEGQDNSPKEMILGEQKLDFKTICKLPFGSYTQVHEDLSITNTIEPRTVGAINLGPTGNVQGAHRLLNLATGEIIVRRKWTELPIPSEVILRLEELSMEQGDEVELLDNDDDDEDVPEESENVTGGTEEPVDETIETREQDNEIPDNITRERDESMDDEEVRTNNTIEELEMQMEEESEPMNVSHVSKSAATVQTSNQKRYNLRPRKDYNYRFAMLSLKAGLKRWGKKAKDAMLDGLKLFLSEEVFEGLNNPTRKQMEMALRIHCFVVEKRDGRIKARAVADGKTQTRYSEEETYSPTVKLESIMLGSLIDAYEKRNIVTIDIKGAFLKAKVPDDMELIVKMDGELAELMCELDPRLQRNEDGILYLRCKKALYGHIEAARLFYDDLNASLTEKLGFIRNKYDPCIYNKRTPDGVITIQTHVDDLKASSRSMRQLEKFIMDLKHIYKEITVHRGNTHDYLGMVMTYDQEKQSVKIDMERYIRESIQDFEEAEPEVKLKDVATPVTENLFKTRTGVVEKLDLKQAALLHATVAKLLFVAKRGRPDILLAVSFLTTCVKQPDEDDWKKLL